MLSKFTSLGKGMKSPILIPDVSNIISHRLHPCMFCGCTMYETMPQGIRKHEDPNQNVHDDEFMKHNHDKQTTYVKSVPDVLTYMYLYYSVVRGVPLTMSTGVTYVNSQWCICEISMLAVSSQWYAFNYEYMYSQFDRPRSTCDLKYPYMYICSRKSVVNL